MEQSDFLFVFKQLQRDFESDGLVLSCTGSANVKNSISTLFSKDMVNCYRCTHSSGCDESTYLTHCHGCKSSHHSQYCIDSEHCMHSSYLQMSSWCTECTYCFGCIGLHKKDFHILNVPYKRDEYFKLTKQLQRQLKVRSTG